MAEGKGNLVFINFVVVDITILLSYLCVNVASFNNWPQVSSMPKHYFYYWSE